jgi:hypothetical protein
MWGPSSAALAGYRQPLWGEGVWIVLQGRGDKAFERGRAGYLRSRPSGIVGAGTWAYRIGGGLLVWLAAVLVGTDVALLVVGPGADGLEALGAALAGAFWGALAGLVAAALFIARPAPTAIRHRWMVLAGLVAVAFLALAVQELLD